MLKRCNFNPEMQDLAATRPSLVLVLVDYTLRKQQNLAFPV